MTNIITFEFNGHDVRAVDIAGETHFVGKDVAERLGYADTTNAMKQHCKGVAKYHPLQTQGGTQEMRVLSEPDVMRLIVNSAMPEAERFERWVFEEVLPSLRKTGSYTMPKPASKVTSILPGPAREFRAAHGIAKLIGLKGNQATLAANKATTRITGVNFLETLGAEKLEAPDQDPHMNVTEMGARLDLTGAAVNNLLIDEGYQTRIRTGGKKGRYRYTPTEAGQRYAVLVDMDKAQAAGKPVQNLEWKASIMPHLALAIKKETS